MYKVMKAEDKSKLVEVFQGSLWEAELVKGLLHDRGIEADTQNALANNTLPESATDVAVVVNEQDYEAAMEVIREREKGNLTD